MLKPTVLLPFRLHLFLKANFCAMLDWFLKFACQRQRILTKGTAFLVLAIEIPTKNPVLIIFNLESVSLETTTKSKIIFSTASSSSTGTILLQKTGLAEFQFNMDCFD